MKSFLIAIFSICSLAQANECRSVFADQPVNYFRSELSAGHFRDDRRFREYSDTFSSSEVLFSTVLESLPKGSTWIDMGAGTAYALTDGLSRNPHLNGVAISFKKPQDLQLSAPYITNLGGRFRYLDGDYLENMAASSQLDPWMGKVSVITDLFGPFSYTSDIARVLQINLDLLAPEGQLFFFFNNDRTKINRTGSLQAMKVMDWLRSISGIEMNVIRVMSHVGVVSGVAEEVVAVQIIKKTAAVRVDPVLQLTNIQYDSPVHRQYDWK